MATKNLARTAIEGGRTIGDKINRHESTRDERKQTREFLQIVKRDPESNDDLATPRRIKNRTYKSEKHADKTNPVRRFLESNVNRSWAKVYAEINEKFDRRNLAGQHIVNSHLLNDVVSYAEVKANRMYALFVIDANNVLRKNDTTRPKYKSDFRRLTDVQIKTLHGWLISRKIRQIDSKLFWLVYAGKGLVGTNVDFNGDVEYFVANQDGSKKAPIVTEYGTYYPRLVAGFRQQHEFSDSDYKVFNNLGEIQKKRMLESGR